MTQRKIPIQNYGILIILLILTVILTIYLAHYYKNRLKYQSNQELTMDILLQLQEEDIASYVVENHDTMIYISSNQQDKEVNEFMKQLISEKGYNKDIVYINIDFMSNEFKNTFTNQYYSKSLKMENRKLETIPTLLIMKGGEVTSILEIIEYQSEIISNFVESKYYGVE